MLTVLLIAASAHAQAPPCGMKPLPSTRPAHGRNIFAFEREPVAVVTVVAPRAQAPAPIVFVEPVAPPPPKFTYRYIGRFGPDANPIAAFTRDGDVLLAHAGDTIDARFVLRTIGIESVQVGRLDGEIETIAIGQ